MLSQTLSTTIYSVCTCRCHCQLCCLFLCFYSWCLDHSVTMCWKIFQTNRKISHNVTNKHNWHPPDHCSGCCTSHSQGQRCCTPLQASWRWRSGVETLAEQRDPETDTNYQQNIKVRVTDYLWIREEHTTAESYPEKEIVIYSDHLTT